MNIVQTDQEHLAVEKCVLLDDMIYYFHFILIIASALGDGKKKTSNL